MKKLISKKEASKKYGIITTGISSMYKYYLLPNGNVVDSDGDVRYVKPIFTPAEFDLLYNGLNVVAREIGNYQTIEGVDISKREATAMLKSIDKLEAKLGTL